MFPIVVGLNYRTAPVGIREKVSVHQSQIIESLQRLYQNSSLAGLVLLSTCNRFEIYAVTKDVEAGINAIKEFLLTKSKDENERINSYFYTHTLYPAVRHLFRVVSGLDSMILGESEILGQVARAYDLSCQAGVSNKITNVMFQKALAVGKRVRTETGIDQYSTSISYTAVELAKKLLGGFQGRKIIILGAGEIGTLTMKHLVGQGALKVVVSNRSLEKARILANECQGKAVLLKNLGAYLEEADLVFAATASKGFIIGSKQIQKIMNRRKHRPMLLIDMAVPRDIDPCARGIEGLTLYDIDDLQDVVDHHQNAKELAARKAEVIVDEEMVNFKKWHNSLFVLPTIIAMQQRGEEIKNEQLEIALAKVGDISPKQQQIICCLANSLVNKLLHTPITSLKEASNTLQGHLYTEIIQNIFALDVNENFNVYELHEVLPDRKELKRAE